MVQFAVLIKTTETTGAGRKHTSTQTIQATSFKDAYAMAKAMNQTSNHDHNRFAEVNFIVTTRSGNSYFPTEQIDEIADQLIRVREAMQADPGPQPKKSLIHTY